MITIMIDTPLNLHDVSNGISLDDVATTPGASGFVVVVTDTRIIPADAASANFGPIKIGPATDRFEDSALRACV
jgi:hypothetical protein